MSLRIRLDCSVGSVHERRCLENEGATAGGAPDRLSADKDLRLQLVQLELAEIVLIHAVAVGCGDNNSREADGISPREEAHLVAAPDDPAPTDGWAWFGPQAGTAWHLLLVGRQLAFSVGATSSARRVGWSGRSR
ncbi:hypothetical protein [Streptomyces sp900116325]|uniref:hypothetical protein n=1 Tax=Streptomyces sp. 900116325 TaxID=3154295 RepID=UPI0033A292EF